MRLLLDTHVLLWLNAQPKRLSRSASALIADPENDCYFSVVSIWEVAVKAMLGRTDFRYDAAALRSVLLDNNFIELNLEARHVLQVSLLPPLHRDPFDRMLLCQAAVERLTLLSDDVRLKDYPVRFKGV